MNPQRHCGRSGVPTLSQTISRIAAVRDFNSSQYRFIHIMLATSYHPVSSHLEAMALTSFNCFIHIMLATSYHPVSSHLEAMTLTSFFFRIECASVLIILIILYRLIHVISDLCTLVFYACFGVKNWPLMVANTHSHVLGSFALRACQETTPCLGRFRRFCGNTLWG